LSPAIASTRGKRREKTDSTSQQEDKKKHGIVFNGRWKRR
jgi:hypothetical protein